MSTSSAGGARTRVAVGGLWAGLTWAVGIVTGPLLAIAIVRSMSHSQYGILVVAASAVGLLTVVSGLGLQAAVSQIAAAERVENPAGGEVATMKGAVTLGLRAALGGVVLAGAAALVFVVVRTLRPATVPLLALSPVVVVAPLAGVASGMYRVLHWPRKLALRTMVSSVILGVLIAVPLLFARVTPLQISGARALASVVALALLGIPLRGYYRGHAQRRVAAVPVKRIMPFASALMLGVAFTAALAELDVFLLGVFRGALVTGLYAPGAAMAAVVAGLPTIVGSLYLPNATDLAVRGELDQLSALYRFATRWSITVAAPALALLLVSPAAVLSLVFGHGIESMASTLPRARLRGGRADRHRLQWHHTRRIRAPPRGRRPTGHLPRSQFRSLPHADPRLRADRCGCCDGDRLRRRQCDVLHVALPALPALPLGQGRSRHQLGIGRRNRAERRPRPLRRGIALPLPGDRRPRRPPHVDRSARDGRSGRASCDCKRPAGQGAPARPAQSTARMMPPTGRMSSELS